MYLKSCVFVGFCFFFDVCDLWEGESRKKFRFDVCIGYLFVHAVVYGVALKK